MATELEIVQKSGTWFSYGKERIGQGRERARDFLKENKEMASEIEAKIRQAQLAGRNDINAKISAGSSAAGDEEWSDIRVAGE
jgi:recombination protein RecA